MHRSYIHSHNNYCVSFFNSRLHYTLMQYPFGLFCKSHAAWIAREEGYGSFLGSFKMCEVQAGGEVAYGKSRKLCQHVELIYINMELPSKWDTSKLWPWQLKSIFLNCNCAWFGWFTQLLAYFMNIRGHRPTNFFNLCFRGSPSILAFLARWLYSLPGSPVSC